MSNAADVIAMKSKVLRVADCMFINPTIFHPLSQAERLARMQLIIMQQEQPSTYFGVPLWSAAKLNINRPPLPHAFQLSMKPKGWTKIRSLVPKCQPNEWTLSRAISVPGCLRQDINLTKT